MVFKFLLVYFMVSGKLFLRGFIPRAFYEHSIYLNKKGLKYLEIRGVV